MQRRTFLKLALGTAFSFAMPLRVNAATSLKGFTMNDEDPAHANVLGADRVRIDWGDWLWNYARDYGATKWAIDLGTTIPNAADVQKAMLHNAYDHRYLSVNEPDLNGLAPQQAVDLVVSQIDAVKSTDANCKFIIGNVSSFNPVFAANSYVGQMWSVFPKSHRKYVSGIGYHYFTGAAVNTQALHTYLKKSSVWINNNLPARMEKCLTQTGLTIAPDDPRVPSYIQFLKSKADLFTNWWVWFPQSYPTNFVTLQEPYSATLTVAGQTFAAL